MRKTELRELLYIRQTDLAEKLHGIVEYQIVSPSVCPPGSFKFLDRHILNVPERANLRVCRSGVIEQDVRVAHFRNEFSMELAGPVVCR